MPQKTFLFLAQLPPPVHGVSMMSQQVYDIVGKMENYHITYLWSGSAKNLKDIDKKSFGKILGFANMVLTLLVYYIKGKRYQITYLTFAPWTHAAIRDGLLAWIAGRLSNRVLLHLHGEGLNQVLRQKGFKNRFIYHAIKGSELIAITKASAQLATDSGLFSKVHFLPNFIHAAPLTQKHFPVRKQGIKILYLGNLDPRKGVLHFLDFIQALHKAGLHISAEIVGAPTKFLSLNDVVQHAKNRGINAFVSVLGPKYGQDKIEYLKQGDLFLYPSQHDYAPLVLIEALSSALVPITYHTGGIAEMVGSAFENHVIDPKLTKEQQNAVILDIVQNYLLNPALLKRDKETALKRYQHHYTKEKFIARFHSILSG